MEEELEMGLEPEMEQAEMPATASPAVPTAAVEPAAPPVRRLEDRELLEFAVDHPGLDARTIAPEVWQAVRRGDSLTKAYDRHELRQLRQSNQQLQRQLGLAQSRNAVRQRSLGSMRSAGGGQSTDSFLNGFNED